MDKAEITIEDHFYNECVEGKGGKEFISVDYSGKTYGGASPCDTEKEIKLSIESAKKVIIENGDKPVIKDLRKKTQLTNWI